MMINACKHGREKPRARTVMYLSKLTDTLESLVPQSCHATGGVAGLCFGRTSTISNITVRRCLLGVDPTIECIDKARELKAHLLITHHPLFTPFLLEIKDLLFEKMRLLTTHNIWLYVVGDALNWMRDGTMDSICQLLQVQVVNHLSIVDENGVETSVGRVCEPKDPVHLADFVARATRSGLGNQPLVHGKPDSEVKKIAVLGGGITSIKVAKRVLELGIDTVIAGELDRDVRMVFRELNIRAVELSHEATDLLGMSRLRMVLALRHPTVSFELYDPATGGASF